jgi:anaerobic ribonucleoside-triphosphate reductase activating protein
MTRRAMASRTADTNYVTFTIDGHLGRLLVEVPVHLPAMAHEMLEALAGPGERVACATPTAVLTLPSATPDELASGPCVRFAGYWHDSLIEGPGRRSVAKLQGCSLHCPGCIAADTWDSAGGVVVPVDRLADALLDPAHARDGVTILGGEPTDQPNGLRALVRALRARGCPHLVLYSGRTYEALRRMGSWQPAIGDVLDQIDVVIDGPYVAALADRPGPWTGSSNQRVLDLAVIRQAAIGGAVGSALATGTWSRLQIGTGNRLQPRHGVEHG